MTRELSTRKVVRTLSLGAVSYLALSLESSGDLQQAFAQTNLPPVTVDARIAGTECHSACKI